MRFKTVLILFIISCNLFSQIEEDAEEVFYTYIEVAKAIGDLNSDGLADSVAVIQDTSNIERPYIFKVFFAEPDNNYKLIVSSVKVVLPDYRPEVDEIDAEKKFSTIYISDGCLYITHSQLRGHFEHKFQYKKTDFILIGYNDISADGMGYLVSSYFNLETAELIVRQERLTTGEVVNLEKEYKLITPLPKLQDFEPLSNEFF